MSARWHVVLLWTWIALRFAAWRLALWHEAVITRSKSVNYAQKSATRVAKNAQNIQRIIAKNAQKLAVNAHPLADQCKAYLIIGTGVNKN
jgi:cell division protein FtsI/penicillin-binding protein 2